MRRTLGLKAKVLMVLCIIAIAFVATNIVYSWNDPPYGEWRVMGPAAPGLLELEPCGNTGADCTSYSSGDQSLVFSFTGNCMGIPVSTGRNYDLANDYSYGEVEKGSIKDFVFENENILPAPCIPNVTGVIDIVVHTEISFTDCDIDPDCPLEETKKADVILLFLLPR